MSPFVQRLIDAATLLGASATVFAIGYSLGKDTNEGTINFIREKHQSLEKSEARLQAENTALKLELQGSRAAPADPRVELTGTASSQAQAKGVLRTQEKPEGNIEKVNLYTGQSASLFEGKITVSLVGVPFEGDPLRHKVIASIGSSGKPNKQLEKVDVGFALIYEDYEVRLLSADTFTATFQVTKLNTKKP